MLKPKAPRPKQMRQQGLRRASDRLTKQDGRIDSRQSILRRSTTRHRQPGRSGALSFERHQRGARAQLSKLRKQTTLALALTTALLVVWQGSEAQVHDEEGTATVLETTPAVNDPTVAIEEATGTLRDLSLSFYGLLPKIGIALLLFVCAAVLAKVVRLLLYRFLGQWEKTEALSALTKIGLYLLALVAALSIMAGDARALLGSVGLVGLALSWALQTPIESFTGWLLNSFRGYYKVGDRIEVGDVFGDVYKIDILTTTVWEAGGPGKSVAGAQPTGAMITFPNWEVLRSNIVNYSREFPYVWDEITVSITNESDLAYAMNLVKDTANRIVGARMKEPAERYRSLLKQARLAFDIAEDPQVFLSMADAWTNLTVRYLVPARERRRWATDLLLGVSKEIAATTHQGKIRGAYPRSEVAVIPLETQNIPNPFPQNSAQHEFS
jgi:small-conductance mechanosensitive channel